MSRDTLNDAINLIREWYYTEIRSLADAAISEVADYVKSEDDPDDDSVREHLDEWLHETIDGHQFVIYTMQAKCALLASDNEDALENETGETGTVEARCYYAMRADVSELLSAREDEWLPSERPEPEDPDDVIDEPSEDVQP